jgi:hypothetical protein
MCGWKGEDASHLTTTKCRHSRAREELLFTYCCSPKLLCAEQVARVIFIRSLTIVGFILAADTCTYAGWKV